MTDKLKQDQAKNQKVSRRKFLKTAAAAGAAAGALGFPSVQRLSAAAPIKWKMQTAWDAGTVGYVKFQDFCKKVGEMTEGQLQVEGLPAGAIVGTFEMFDAVKAGVFDAMHCFDVYWPGKIPAATFFSSYPFGMDRPDQWDTWYTALGGKEIAREAYGKHNMMWLGPIQHDDNLIHSKVPIRSFEDFQGKKIRYPGGIIADIYRAAGVSTVLLPGGEVYPALEKGVIDRLGHQLQPGICRSRQVRHPRPPLHPVPAPAGRLDEHRGEYEQMECAARAFEGPVRSGGRLAFQRSLHGDSEGRPRGDSEVYRTRLRNHPPEGIGYREVQEIRP